MTETPFAQEENHDEIMADPLMHEREWMLYAIVLDGEGGGKSLDESELNQWKPEDGTLWLHLDLSVEGTTGCLIAAISTRWFWKPFWKTKNPVRGVCRTAIICCCFCAPST